MWRAHRLPGSGQKRNTPVAAAYRPFTLDLRNWMVFRGEQPPSAHSGWLQLPRAPGPKNLLPSGKPLGDYEVLLSSETGRALAAARGEATIQTGIKTLRIQPGLAKVGTGSYSLTIGKLGAGDRTFPPILM